MSDRETDPFCEPCRERLVIKIHELSKSSSASLTERASASRVTVKTAVPGARIRWEGIEAEGLVAELPWSAPRRTVTVRVEEARNWVRGRLRPKATYVARFVLGRGAAVGGEVLAPTEVSPVAIRPTASSTPEGSWPRRGTIAGTSSLRFRAGPGTGSEILGVLSRGQEISVTGLSVGGWTPVVAFHAQRHCLLQLG